VPQLAREYAPGFPGSLNGAPLLLPAAGSRVRGLLESWFQDRDLRVCVEGEFDDAAMMRLFGSKGCGLFPLPSVLAPELVDADAVMQVGEFDGIVDRFYGLSIERRPHRAELRAILETGPKHHLSQLRKEIPSAGRRRLQT
jgi:LysR family transcriptional activator of nhaA